MFSSYRQGVQAQLPTSVNRQVGAGGGIPRTYDHLYRKHAGVIPVQFMRALAYSESRVNPNYELEKGIDVSTRSYPSGKKDSFWGLFQVGINNVLKGYNKEHGTGIAPSQLFDPDINTMLASNTLNRIVRAYAQLHRKFAIDNLRPDFGNLEFVRLLVAGWNSGYSNKGGVGKVAMYLKARGIPVTHENVFKHAKEAGATKFLDIGQYKKKFDWQRRVARRFFEEQARDKVAINTPGGPSSPGGKKTAAALSVLSLFLIAALS